MSTLSIRRATADDSKNIAVLERECFCDPWSEDGISDTIRTEGGIFLIAERSSSAVGYIGATTVLDECSITNICITKSERGKGYARALLSAMKNKCKQAGIRCIFLEVRRSNLPAVTLYESSGYVLCGERRGFYSHPKEDALIYRLDI